MSNFCLECGQHPADGCRNWCASYTPPTVYRHQTPRARNTDPATSHHAATAVANVTETQQAILEAYRAHGPLIDEDLCRRLADALADPVSVSGVRTRRAELVETGDVHDTGQTRPTISGRAAIVWDVRR